MPKQRAKRKKTGKGKSKASNIGVFIVVGLICATLVWYIIRDTSILERSKNDEKSEQEATAPGAKGKNSNNGSQISPTDLSAAPAEQSLDLIIESTLENMDIASHIYRRQTKPDSYIYNVPLNRGEMEMNYANMLFKGYVERGGGVLDTAIESGSKQIMTFSKKGDPKKYQVVLYYDSKPYATKITSRNIAIVVDDFGTIGGELLEGFLDLPPEVTFAIFPEMHNSVHTMDRAHQQGRESIIHVPMEPIGFPKVDPGKNAILVQMKDGEIDRLINRFINNMPLCIGINNHMGSLATTDPDIMQAVMITVKARDRIFLDSRTSNVSVAYQTAQKAHIPAFRNDIFLDSPDISKKTMDAKLEQIISMSATNNSIIAITHCHNKDKLVYLREFIARLRKEGFNLVPLSKIGKYSVPQIL
ncbi:MAG: divergent polysaccharide deacetylase family protein [Candidatus Cloacimonadaceae bacterium]|nr:divergent polysaccharide deacetylase family protein [Candidatus Cloacimonadaceae bacterium]MDP3113354.1 divergent polysaccharide deacetylase family protein [Candidatus Cloacimonadaceae bacterium]